MKIKMTPVAMKRPTSQSIYAPNPFKSIIEVEESILSKQTSHPMLVSFEPDGVSSPKHRKAYFLKGSWHIISSWVHESATEQQEINEDVQS